MTRDLYRKILLLLLLLAAIPAAAADDSPEKLFWAFDSSNGMADNSAQTIRCTKTGRIVISTIGHINFYDGLSFTHIDPQKSDVFPLPGYHGHYHLYFDRYHHLWLKDKHQVTCVDLLTERFISDVRGVIKSFGIRHTVEDMFVDGNGDPWFMSDGKLYGKDERTVLPLRESVTLHDVDVHDSTLLMLFYSDGVVTAYKLDDGRLSFEIAMSDESESLRYAASSVTTRCDKGFLQIRNGSKEAMLRRLDVESRRWTTLMEQPYHLNNAAIYKDNIYIASEYGYWVHNINTGKQTHCEELTLSKGRKLRTDINTIEFDRQGGMWLGTENRGLLYAKPYPPPFSSYSWSDPRAMTLYDKMHAKLGTVLTYHRPVNCVYKDSRGWTWTGTYAGLQLQKRQGDKVTTLKREDGLSNEMIHAVIEDDNHDIWVSTSYGIAHLFVKNDEVTRIESYVLLDNVPNESFVNGCAAKMDDGSIVMQALDHMVTFNPAKFHPDFLDMMLFPKLIRLNVDGFTVQPGQKVDGRVILDRAVTRTKGFSVNYDQNSIRMTFAGLNYQRSIQTYWRVRVKGTGKYDDWQVFSYYNSGGLVDKYGMLQLPLAGMKPGIYDVEVQASFSPDRWPQEPFVWSVKVEEPWWRTTGLYMAMTFLLLLLAIADVFLFNRNTRLSMMRLNGEHELMRRIGNFVLRCNRQSNDKLVPLPSDLASSDQQETSDEFVEAMVKIVPFVNSQEGKSYTLDQMSAATGIDIAGFCDLVSSQLEKNPRQVAVRLRLMEGEQLLRKSNMTVDEISEECHFASPNFFISTFYHHYRMTPADYRRTHS
jgi:AraC-like DNA-binding protein/ligand-binding sensor domain-containing protein